MGKIEKNPVVSQCKNRPVIFNFGDSNSDTGGLVAGLGFSVNLPNGRTFFNRSTESRAITKYIANQYSDQGTDLVFRDPKEQAIESLWTEVEAHHFDTAGSKLNWELAVKPKMYGAEGDQAVIEENKVKLAMVLDVYEKRLSESKYLGGDRFSLADLHHLPTAEYLLLTSVKELFDARPRVTAWLADITSRPAWTKVIELRNQALNPPK